MTPEEQVRGALDQVMKENITLHSIRGGYGVFNITSFKTICDQILSLKYANGEKMLRIQAENQEVDLTALETIGSTEPIHFRVYRLMWEQGWRKCFRGEDAGIL